MKKVEIDHNIAYELEKLHLPIKLINGKTLTFAKGNRNVPSIDHISDKKHHLTIRDIQQVIVMINYPLYITKSNKKKNNIIIYGKRKGVNKKHLLKVVIREKEEDKWEIVTIYPTKKKSEN